MRHAITNLELRPILERIGKVLHAEHDKITTEQIPSRWVDLIRYLDDKERQQSEAPRHKPEPPPEY
jgi:hypothetical protein